MSTSTPSAFPLTTADPAFDPNQPVTVNGFLYVPAAGLRRAATAPQLMPGRAAKTTIEVQRRKAVEHG